MFESENLMPQCMSAYRFESISSRNDLDRPSPICTTLPISLASTASQPGTQRKAIVTRVLRSAPACHTAKSGFASPTKPSYEITEIPYCGKRRSVVTTTMLPSIAVAIKKRSAGSRCMSGSSVALNMTSSESGISDNEYASISLCISALGSRGSSMPPCFHFSDISHSEMGLTYSMSASRMAFIAERENFPNSPFASLRTAHVSSNSGRTASLPIR